MLELKNISYEVKSGGSRLKILDHLSLHFNSGLTVITGPNGSGKSTLSSIIMGLKKPTSGRILLEKKDITNLSITDRAKKGLALSFQQPIKFKGVTVYDLLNIANGELISEKEAGKFLKEVGLEPAKYLLREVNNKLSGGELKRIEIASVLSRHAKITIFDEPEAGIDLWSFTNLTNVFKKMKKEHRTVIIVSHQERILNIADRIVVLENGKIKNSGTPATILPEVTGGRHAA